MITRNLVLATLSATLLTGAAIAQTASPSPPSSSTGAAPATTASKAPETNLAGQGKWRASKLMGVDIYGPDDKKVGDVTEVILDKTGKIEMVTVGVGGFLGIGSKDVAIPFDQVTWSDQPMATAAPAPAAPAGGTANTGTSGTGTAGTGTSGGMSSAPATTAATPRAPAMYPDHGKISMTKDQLNSAPAVTYSGT